MSYTIEDKLMVALQPVPGQSQRAHREPSFSTFGCQTLLPQFAI